MESRRNRNAPSPFWRNILTWAAVAICACLALVAGAAGAERKKGGDLFARYPELMVGEWQDAKRRLWFFADGTYWMNPFGLPPDQFERNPDYRHGTWRIEGPKLIQDGGLTHLIVLLDETTLIVTDGERSFTSKRLAFAPGKKASPRVPMETPARSKVAVPPPSGALTPKMGSAERQAILNVLRADFYPDARLAISNPQKIQFMVHHLRVKDGWACVHVTPTKNQRDFAEPRWALLQWQDGQWTDVNYMEKLRPFPDESAAADALEMTDGTIAKLRELLPDCPAAIFP